MIDADKGIDLGFVVWATKVTSASPSVGAVGGIVIAGGERSVLERMQTLDGSFHVQLVLAVSVAVWLQVAMGSDSQWGSAMVGRKGKTGVSGKRGVGGAGRPGC